MNSVVDFHMLLSTLTLAFVMLCTTLKDPVMPFTPKWVPNSHSSMPAFTAGRSMA